MSQVYYRTNEWYQKAAKNGCAEATRAVGYLYYAGKGGVIKDYEKELIVTDQHKACPAAQECTFTTALWRLCGALVTFNNHPYTYRRYTSTRNYLDTVLLLGK